MSFWYTKALARLNPTDLTGDIRAALVMSNTTIDTEEDVEFLSGFTTLDEYDGASYARQALTGEAFTNSLANDRQEWTSDSIVFASLGVGTRQAVGMLLYLHVTDDTDSVPLAFVDTGGFPFDGNGENVTINPAAAGWMLIRNAA